MRNICFLIILLLSIFPVSANKTDSIYQLFSQEKNYKIQIKYLNEIFNIEINDEPKKCLEIAEKILFISKTNNYPTGEAMGYGNKAMYFFTQGDFKNALNHYQTSLQLKIKNKDTNGIATTYFNMALLFAEQGKLEKAITYYYKSLEIKEKLNQHFQVGQIYNNIALLYINLNKFDKASELLNKSYDIFLTLIQQFPEERKYKVSAAETLTNLGSIEYYKNNLNLALVHFFNAKKLFIILDNKVSLSTIYSNIGSIYTETNQLDKALLYQNKALQTVLQTGDQLTLQETYRELGLIYDKLNNYKNAIENYNISLNIALKSNLNEEIKIICLELSKIYEKQNDFQNSLKYYKLYSDAKDSIFNTESQKIFNEIQEKYESAKKDEEIKNLHSDSKIKQKNITKLKYLIYIVLGIVIILILIAFQLYKKYKKNKNTRILLSKQKEEILNKHNTYSQIQPQQDIAKYAHSKLTEDDIDKLFSKISNYLEKTKLYLNNELTLPILAKNLSVSSNQLSQVINSKTNLNFNEYINAFRIIEAQKRLISEEYKNITIEGIGKSVGFNSKATFFTAFKKICNITPSEFIKQNKQ